jgi:hypothetical protein
LSASNDSSAETQASGTSGDLKDGMMVWGREMSQPEMPGHCDFCGGAGWDIADVGINTIVNNINSANAL